MGNEKEVDSTNTATPPGQENEAEQAAVGFERIIRGSEPDSDKLTRFKE